MNNFFSVFSEKKPNFLAFGKTLKIFFSFSDDFSVLVIPVARRETQKNSAIGLSNWHPNLEGAYNLIPNTNQYTLLF